MYSKTYFNSRELLKTIQAKFEMLNDIWALKLNYFTASTISVKIFCCFITLFLNRAHLAMSTSSYFSTPEAYSLAYCFPVLLSGMFLMMKPLFLFSTTGSISSKVAFFTFLLEVFLVVLFSLWTVHQTVVLGYSSVSPFYSLLLAAHLPFIDSYGWGSTFISFITVVVSWGFVPIWRVDALEILFLLFSPEFVIHVYGVCIYMVNLFILFLSNTIARISLK